MKRFRFFLIVAFLIGMIASPIVMMEEGKRDLVLATTTSTKDSGLLDYLLPIYEKERGIRIKVISVGTGQAIKTAEMGNCDLILVHARVAEDKFVADGFGVNRKDVMYNDFIIVGPPKDPAKISGLKSIPTMKALARGKAKFLSRGDNSGTNMKEVQLWEESGIKPQGSWYLSVGKGMGDTLVMANELQAYTLTDRGTFAAMRNRLNLEIMVEGEPSLLNPYGIIAVNPDKYPQVNFKESMAFIDFITSPRGKQLINGYKINGEQIFYVQ